MKNILFRSDSSFEIGVGHIMRDLVLASRYPDDNVIFACQELSGNLNEEILKSGYELKIINSNDIKEIDDIIVNSNIDMIIIDNYNIDYDFEKTLKKTHNNLIIFVLDDTYQKHYCDILLNHNISANKEKYKTLVPKKCDIRCGKKYTLIRDEFIKEKKTINALLVMGGSDSQNLNIKIVKILENFSNLRVKILSTKANKNIKELEKYINNNQHIELIIDSTKIAKLMKNSNFIICTPSMIINEAYYMQLPFIAIKVADNQNDLYEFLKDEGYLTLENFNESELKSKIKTIISQCKI